MGRKYYLLVDNISPRSFSDIRMCIRTDDYKSMKSEFYLT